uniref:Uncharacterized protein n=1 Tax=Arundo donax TaxID=35708 RepID=A0A0A9A0J6_ARUDO
MESLECTQGQMIIHFIEVLPKYHRIMSSSMSFGTKQLKID